MTLTLRDLDDELFGIHWIDESFGLPFRWDPSSTTLATALEESRRYWQDPDHGAMPAEFIDALHRAVDEKTESGLEENSLQVGQKFPDFFLPNQLGHMVRSDSLRRRGPLVVTFYRGGWNPYCNFTLRAMQRVLPDIERLGGQLVAITPEQSDYSLSTVGKNGLSFDVLTDDGLRVAKGLGLNWQIPDEILQWQEEHFGLFLEEHNGVGNGGELPVTATYVINRDGIVVWRHVEAAYWKRAEPSDVVKAIEQAATGK